MQFFGQFTHKTRDFIKRDLWRVRTDTASPLYAIGVRLLRIMILAMRTFKNHQCMLRASSLTFYSLLSIVPVAAMAFGVATGFGFEKRLEKQLLADFQGQEQIVTQVIQFAHSLLENTKGGLIAGIGIGMLFYTVIMVLSHIENSLNAIWEIESSRNIGRKISDYLSMMIIAPLLFIISGSISVFIQSQVMMITQKLSFLSIMGAVIIFSLKFLPIVLIWVLFSIVYILMPNTRVRFGSGVFGGIVAGTIFIIVQWAYIHFQVGVARNNAIYGSFAALPLFLLWLQISWVVLMAGAALSTAHQKYQAFGYFPECQGVSGRSRWLTGLCMVRFAVDRFMGGRRAATETELAGYLHMPRCMVEGLADELVEGGILSRVQLADETEFGYQPARDLPFLTPVSVIRALETRGEEYVPETEDDMVQKLAGCLENMETLVEKSPGNKPLNTI